MARTAAVLPGGARLSDYLSLGVIAQVFPAGGGASRAGRDRSAQPAAAVAAGGGDGLLRDRDGAVSVGSGP